MLDQWAAALLHPWRKQRGGGSGAAVWRKKGRDVEEEGRAAAAVAEEPVTTKLRLPAAAASDRRIRPGGTRAGSEARAVEAGRRSEVGGSGAVRCGGEERRERSREGRWWGRDGWKWSTVVLDAVVLAHTIVLDPPRSAIVLTGRSPSPSALPFLHSMACGGFIAQRSQSLAPLVGLLLACAWPVRWSAGPGSSQWMRRCGPPGCAPSLVKPTGMPTPYLAMVVNMGLLAGTKMKGTTAMASRTSTPTFTVLVPPHHLHSICNIRTRIGGV
ncbi:hypothetical protein SORBI_3001G147800 [Sorghum bicolor]|uniref:Uncharacterized protein n=1 Tax=Sorghum bicolor TaxID=4558 RepID=A0A1B6QJ01_SORBI|nr:hypothetical protein SORBI_3001G147800 [Sorghum bicolor]